MTFCVRPEDRTIEHACRKCGARAGNLFLTRQLLCSGAALVVLNRALGGDLTQQTAIRLAAGLGDGMGGSGCLCGALNGGALALGLFLGTGRLAPGGDKKVLHATRDLHKAFKSAFGSTCCRVLTNKTKKGSQASHQSCAQRTATSAELAAALILNHHPELVRRIDWDYLNQKDGLVGARFKIAANLLSNAFIIFG